MSLQLHKFGQLQHPGLKPDYITFSCMGTVTIQFHHLCTFMRIFLTDLYVFSKVSKSKHGLKTHHNTHTLK